MDINKELRTLETMHKQELNDILWKWWCCDYFHEDFTFEIRENNPFGLKEHFLENPCDFIKKGFELISDLDDLDDDDADDYREVIMELVKWVNDDDKLAVLIREAEKHGI